MIMIGLLWLWVSMLLVMMHHSSPGQGQREVLLPPKIERLAFVRRDFVDPGAPQRILVTAHIPTHLRITREGETYELGGEGKPVGGFVLRFAEPFRLRDGRLARSTDDLLAQDGAIAYARNTPRGDHNPCCFPP